MDQVEYRIKEAEVKIMIQQADALLFIGEQLKRIADELQAQRTPEVSVEVARLFEQP